MEKNQNDFADRLRRIEAKKGARPVTPEPATPPRSKKPSKSERDGGLTPLMRQGLAALGAVITFAGMFIWTMLPEWQRQKEMFAEQAAEEAAQPKPVSEIAAEFKVTSPLDERRKDAETRFVSDLGWRLWPGEVATPDHGPLSIETLASGYAPEPNAVPGAVTTLDPNRRCQLRRPQPGEVVRNIRIDEATGETGLHVLSKPEIAETLIDHMRAQYGRGKRYLRGRTADGRMYRADVFVTDTSAPVYLVLQTKNQNTLWALHLAPGATLAHVAMIGKNNALVGLPAGVEAEALRISDFVPGFELGSEEEGQPCMVAPYRKPQEHWKGVARANVGNEHFVALMQTYETGYAAFNAWYTGALGVDAGRNLTEAHHAAHILAGPVPDAPIPYQSIKGQPVLVTPDEFVLKGDAALKNAHVAVMLEAAGGEIALLNPAAVRRAPDVVEGNGQ